MDIAFNPADYPTYNIGDKVTIRQWDDMASEFGLNVFGDIKVPKACFTEPMRKYCGKTLTIVRKNYYLSPNSDCYYFGGSTMVFTSLMFVTASPSWIAGAFCRLSTSSRARDDTKRPTTEPKQAITRHAQDKLLIHPKKTVSHQLVPCFILNLFLPSERINHYDQTYLHSRYHQRYCLL